MGQFDGIISPEFKLLHKDAIDALLLDEALTRPCTFYYGTTRFDECTNCIYNHSVKEIIWCL